MVAEMTLPDLISLDLTLPKFDADGAVFSGCSANVASKFLLFALDK